MNKIKISKAVFHTKTAKTYLPSITSVIFVIEHHLPWVTAGCHGEWWQSTGRVPERGCAAMCGVQHVIILSLAASVILACQESDAAVHPALLPGFPPCPPPPPRWGTACQHAGYQGPTWTTRRQILADVNHERFVLTAHASQQTLGSMLQPFVHSYVTSDWTTGPALKSNN